MKEKLLKNLREIQNLSNEDKEKLVINLPVSSGTYLYSNFADEGQVKELLEDWHLVASQEERATLSGDNVRKIQKLYRRKIKSLVSALRKNKKYAWVPDQIKELYK